MVYGKKLLAKEFARKIMCLNNELEESCSSCVKFKTNNHPDFELIEPDNGTIKIEQIRNMQEQIAQKPIIANKKVYIITDSECMTNEATDSYCSKEITETYGAYVNFKQYGNINFNLGQDEIVAGTGFTFSVSYSTFANYTLCNPGLIVFYTRNRTVYSCDDIPSSGSTRYELNTFGYPPNGYDDSHICHYDSYRTDRGGRYFSIYESEVEDVYGSIRLYIGDELPSITYASEYYDYDGDGERMYCYDVYEEGRNYSWSSRYPICYYDRKNSVPERVIVDKEYDWWNREYVYYYEILNRDAVTKDASAYCFEETIKYTPDSGDAGPDVSGLKEKIYKDMVNYLQEPQLKESNINTYDENKTNNGSGVPASMEDSGDWNVIFSTNEGTYDSYSKPNMWMPSDTPNAVYITNFTLREACINFEANTVTNAPVTHVANVDDSCDADSSISGGIKWYTPIKLKDGTSVPVELIKDELSLITEMDWDVNYNCSAPTRQDLYNIPGDGSFKFVFLSDLHGYVFGNNNEKLIKAIDETGPDAIICGGDMFTAHAKDGILKYESGFDLIKNLSGKYKVYYGNGNHEYKVKSFTKEYGNFYERYCATASCEALHQEYSRVRSARVYGK